MMTILFELMNLGSGSGILSVLFRYLGICYLQILSSRRCVTCDRFPLIWMIGWTYDIMDGEKIRCNIAGLGSSVGRALDWRSKGPWFDPGSGHYPDISGGRHFFLAVLVFVSFEKMKVFLIEMFIKLIALIIFNTIEINLDNIAIDIWISAMELCQVILTMSST